MQSWTEIVKDVQERDWNFYSRTPNRPVPDNVILRRETASCGSSSSGPVRYSRPTLIVATYRSKTTETSTDCLWDGCGAPVVTTGVWLAVPNLFRHDSR